MRMKHRLWTMLLAWILIIVFWNGGVYAQTEVNSEFNSVQDTLDWYSSATYGISLPIAGVGLPGRPWNQDLGREDIMNWGMDVQMQKSSEIYNVQYDEAYYDFWCSYAKEMGAEFVVTVLNCANGFSFAPNPVADEYMWEEQGVERGKCNTSVNYINMLYESCEKYGLKLGLYAVSDWGTRHSPVCVGKGNSNTPVTDEYCQRMCDVYKYWSESFGERVSYWWMDGSYMWEGWHEEPLIKLKAALKAGNPNAIVSFSDGPGDWDNHYMQNDFTANEGYGIEAVPDGRLINGIQWHRYLPLWEYDGDGSAYSIPEMVEYVKKVRENGGFMHLGSGGTWEVGKGYDSTQTALYKALKKYVIDGEEMPDYIDGSEKIQAGDCTKMIRLAKAAPKMNSYTCQVSNTFAPRLMDTVPFGTRGLMWNFPGQKSWTINSEVTGKNGNLELWAGYENIRIPEGTNNIAISVKDYDEENKKNWPQIVTEENHMEIRIGDKHGAVIADNIKGVGYIDFFKFTDGEYYEEPVEGYHIVNIPIEPLSGEQDVYLVNVIQDRTNDELNVYRKNNIAKCITAVSGEVSCYENAVGSLDGTDELKISGVDFGDDEATSLTLWTGTGMDEADNCIDIYVNSPYISWKKIKIGTYYPENNGWGEFRKQTIDIIPISGIRDVYLQANGSAGVADIKAFKFNKKSDDYEIPNTEFWGKASTSSSVKQNVQGLFDGETINSVSWKASDKVKQARRSWVAVDLGREYELSSIMLENPIDGENIALPSAYNVYLSVDDSVYEKIKGVTEGGNEAHIASRVNPTVGSWQLAGSYTSADVKAKFTPTVARYVLIYVTQAANTYCGIDEFHAYSPIRYEKKDYNFNSIEKTNWKAKAWKTLYDGSDAVNMIDGNLGNTYGDAVDSESNIPYVMVDMGESVNIGRVVMQNKCPNQWYMPKSFRVYVSESAEAFNDENSSEWKLVAENVMVKGSIADAKFSGKQARYFMLKPDEVGVNAIDEIKDWMSYGEIFAYKTVCNVEFLNDGDKPITSLTQADGKIKLSFDINGDENDVFACMAAYKGGVLQAVINMDETMEMDVTKDIDRVSAFFWNKNLEPFAKVHSLGY